MNKKRLSVVMAGAMLATSVAPVLAAEDTVKEYTVSASEWEVIKSQINKTMKDNAFKSTTTLSDAGTTNATYNAKKYFSADAADEMVSVQSKYGFAEGDATPSFAITENGKTLSTGTMTATNTVLGAGGALSGIVAGDTISVYEWTQTSDFFGIKIPTLVSNKKTSLGKYTRDDLVTNYSTGLEEELKHASKDLVSDSGTGLENGTGIIKTVKTDGAGTVTITLNAYKDINDPDSNKVITLKEGSEKLDFNMPLDKEGNLLDVTDGDEMQKFDHFANYEYETGYTNANKDLKYKKVATIKVSADAVAGETHNVDDLYDGVLLTAEGSAIANEYKYYNEVLGSGRAEVVTVADANNDGIYELVINFKQKDVSANVKTVTVLSTDKTKLSQFENIVKTGSKLGIIGGNNRYETAVQVALKAGLEVDNSTKNNIVLVNGESLVDGLTAAPLSATVNTSGDKAPILLTKKDSLPKETKDFILKATENLTKKQRADVTINLVGGRSVLSDELVSEIEELGFKVERFGGANREATSLKVAEKMNKANAFVVGGNGEADAMSISAVSAESETPIIVSSVHGLSQDALDYLDSKSGKVTIIGGTNAVTEAEEKAIEAVKENQTTGVIERLAGANRFETNAKVIEKYFADLNNKVVSVTKDGVADKGELVDSLSAATLGGPIVLASKEVSEVQQKALLRASLVGKLNAEIHQVGLGTSDSIIRTLSKALKITN